jgi:hypothetical protein
MPWSPDNLPVAQQKPREILIFEPEAEGHTLEWLDAIVRLAATERADLRLWLVVAEGLCTPLAHLLPADAPIASGSWPCRRTSRGAALDVRWRGPASGAGGRCASICARPAPNMGSS